METPFELASPTHLQIEVTEGCDHSCFYCYNHWRPNSSSNRDMEFEDAKILSEKIIKEIRPFIITITGGEPFRNFEATKHLTKRLGEANISVGINTNLVETDRGTLEEILIVNKEVSLLVSLPSINREIYRKITGKDTLPKFFENLREVSQIGINVYVNMVAHQLNKEQVFEEARFLFEEYGLKSFAVTPMLRPALRRLDRMDLTDKDNEKIYRELIRLREELGINTAILEVTPKCGVPEELRDDIIFSRGCSAGKITSAISYNGEVRVCAHAPFSHGNLLTEDFSVIWERMKPWRIHGYIPIDCQECVELSECKGGCRFAAYQDGQQLSTKDYRMKTPIKHKRLLQPQDISEDGAYEAVPFRYRMERAGQYVLNNKSKIIFGNREVVDFLELLQTRGPLKLAEIPEGPLREKARGLGQILISKRFIKRR